jgi:hypothetical protein
VTRGTPEPRKITGWAKEDILLPVGTLNAVARDNPHAAFPVSGDAKRRPAWILLNHTEAQRLLNMGPISKAGAA